MRKSHTISMLNDQKRIKYLPNSAIVKQPPCHASCGSNGFRISMTDPTTSSPKSFGKRLVILPIPLAADHLISLLGFRIACNNSSIISSISDDNSISSSFSSKNDKQQIILDSSRSEKKQSHKNIFNRI